MDRNNQQCQLNSSMEDNTNHSNQISPEASKPSHQLLIIPQNISDQELISKFQDNYQTSRFRQLDIASVDFNLPNYYKLNSAILVGTDINTTMRSRLRVFLLIESTRFSLTRQTCALACTFMDLFHLNKGVCMVQQYQNLSLGCLILASKLSEGKFPVINYQIFNQEQLLNWQRKIAKKLNYCLSPPTYISFAQKYILLWDSYAAKSSIFNIQISVCPNGYNEKIRRFYQHLDTLYLNIASLNYSPVVITINMLYIHTKILNQKMEFDQRTKADAEFLSVFYERQQDNFKSFFLKFLKQLKCSHDQNLNPNLGLMIKDILFIEISTKPWRFAQTNPSLNKARCWDLVQTCTTNRYQTFKNTFNVNR